jgi:hypothetical protein
MLHHVEHITSESNDENFLSEKSATPAECILRAYRECTQIFGKDMLFAPTWEIFLILQVNQRGLTMDELLQEFNAAPAESIIKRWVDILVLNGVVITFEHEGSTVYASTPVTQLNLGRALQKATCGGLSS